MHEAHNRLVGEKPDVLCPVVVEIRGPIYAPKDNSHALHDHPLPPPNPQCKQIDDQEADMDLACAKESSCMEALRRMEIRRGLGLAARDRVKAIRRERMRWAVRTTARVRWFARRGYSGKRS